MQKLGPNDPCWCGSGKKYKRCHKDLCDKMEGYKLKGVLTPDRKLLKTPEQLEHMRESAKINIAILDNIGQYIKEGITTEEIDQIIYKQTTEMGGIPAPLNYEGFPKSVCTSINDQVCHGIPSKDVVLKNGDIINVDCSTILNGYFSDSSRMFCVGDVHPEYQRLVDVAKESVMRGLAEVKPWGLLGDVGAAVNSYVMENGYSVVREIGGHGIGLEFHEDPWVGYTTPKGTGMLLVPGLVFTIEPMVNMGKPDIFIDEDDGWTVYTKDGSPSAQWEIMVAVTETGYEIMSY